MHFELTIQPRGLSGFCRSGGPINAPSPGGPSGCDSRDGRLGSPGVRTQITLGRLHDLWVWAYFGILPQPEHQLCCSLP